MSTNVPFADLGGADLYIERVYEGGTAGTSADDPINRLVRGVGNQGGFRPRKSPEPKLVVLYTSGAEPEWPDAIDPYSGMFTYFGDNRKPGKDLHAADGNRILKYAFACVDKESGETYNVNLRRKEGRWPAGGINSRFNDGANGEDFLGFFGGLRRRAC